MDTPLKWRSASTQLGGKPNFNPEGLLSRSASQYVEGENLVDMIRENLVLSASRWTITAN